MSKGTKIIVLKSKELVYTGIFIVLGALLILLLFYMFSPKKDKGDEQIQTTQNVTTEVPEATPTSTSDTESVSSIFEDCDSKLEDFEPGVYTSVINLGGTNYQLSFTVNPDTAPVITIDNIDELTTAMYPLLTPSIDELNNQLSYVDDLCSLTYSSDNKYTSIIILEGIRSAISN